MKVKIQNPQENENVYIKFKKQLNDELTDQKIEFDICVYSHDLK